MTPGNFDLISLVYAIAAAFTVVELVRHWRAFVDTVFTPSDDLLAARAGFLLLTPVGVLLHEAAHYLIATGTAAAAVRLDFRIYWGFVSYRGLLPPEASFAIAAAGPFMSALLAVVALAAALRVPQPFRAVLAAFGASTALLVVVLYPAMSFMGGYGDYLTIYSARTPFLAGTAAFTHVLFAAASLWLYRLHARTPARTPWRWQPAGLPAGVADATLEPGPEPPDEPEQRAGPSGPTPSR